MGLFHQDLQPHGGWKRTLKAPRFEDLLDLSCGAYNLATLPKFKMKQPEKQGPKGWFYMLWLLWGSTWKFWVRRTTNYLGNRKQSRNGINWVTEYQRLYPRPRGMGRSWISSWPQFFECPPFHACKKKKGTWMALDHIICSLRNSQLDHCLQRCQVQVLPGQLEHQPTGGILQPYKGIQKRCSKYHKNRTVDIPESTPLLVLMFHESSPCMLRQFGSHDDKQCVLCLCSTFPPGHLIWTSPKSAPSNFSSPDMFMVDRPKENLHVSTDQFISASESSTFGEV